MPIMRHFCLFTALGILMLYLLSITLFLACLVLDERRIDKRQGTDQITNALVLIQDPSMTRLLCRSRTNYMQRLISRLLNISRYGDMVILSNPVCM